MVSDEEHCDVAEVVVINVKVKTDPCNIHSHKCYWPVEDGTDVVCHYLASFLFPIPILAHI